jgi:hypothetical protein
MRSCYDHERVEDRAAEILERLADGSSPGRSVAASIAPCGSPNISRQFWARYRSPRKNCRRRPVETGTQCCSTAVGEARVAHDLLNGHAGISNGRWLSLYRTEATKFRDRTHVGGGMDLQTQPPDCAVSPGELLATGRRRTAWNGPLCPGQQGDFAIRTAAYMSVAVLRAGSVGRRGNPG